MLLPGHPEPAAGLPGPGAALRLGIAKNKLYELVLKDHPE